MTNHELPFVLTADDQQLIERKLAELPQSADGNCTLSVFLSDARQVSFAQDGEIVSWSDARRRPATCACAYGAFEARPQV